MSVLGIGISYGVATLFAMFSGMPIAFALGAVAVVFMAIFMPVASLDTVTQNVYEEMASITLLSIPLFILKGAAIGKSRAGQDLYSALHAWLHRVPGGLGVANVFACALFAAMAGSSPATCSAIGSAGIPEMRKRGYSGGFAAGIIAECQKNSWNVAVAVVDTHGYLVYFERMENTQYASIDIAIGKHHRRRRHARHSAATLDHHDSVRGRR